MFTRRMRPYSLKQSRRALSSVLYDYKKIKVSLCNISKRLTTYQVGHEEGLVGVTFDVGVVVGVPYKRTSRARVSDQV